LDGLDVVGAGVGLGVGAVVGGATVGFALVGAGAGALVPVPDVEVPGAGLLPADAVAPGDRDGAADRLGDGPAWLGDGCALGWGVVDVVGAVGAALAAAWSAARANPAAMPHVPSRLSAAVRRVIRDSRRSPKSRTAP
jgi:hypothetical protein